MRWLATIVGALHGRTPVELVIDNDGVFLFHRAHPRDRAADDVLELRAAETEVLERMLAEHIDNRWVPEGAIDHVVLRERKLAALSNEKATLTILTTDGDELRIFLVSPKQVDPARAAFRDMLGARFEG